jgi:hypothetical protein
VEKQLKTGVLSEAAFANPVEEGEGSRWAYMLERVFAREEYFSASELWMSLVQKEMVREVGEGEWWVMEDGFKTVFLSATVRQEGKQAELTLVALLSAEETRRAQVVEEPLGALGLGSVRRVQGCREGERLKLLLGDDRSYFLFDFTQQEWHL